MSEYMTEQRRELISFFRANPDKRFSAKEVAHFLEESNISISAIYRNLSKLEQDGYISRTMKEGSRESFYQCLMSEKCRNCIHMSCVKCGKTFHMDHAAAAVLMNAVSQRDGFEISKEKTVLYGVCGTCNGGKNENKK